MIKKYLFSENRGLRLSENFTLSEFVCADKNDEVLVSDELIALLQRVRDHFGKPVIITSAYRTASHNKKVGGTSKSYHLTGEAADFVVSGISPARVGYYLDKLGASGIGVYLSSGFVHLDVRSNGKWRGLISSDKEENLSEYFPTLYKGKRGNSVRLLQTLLNVDADGIFGNQTREAVKKYQRENGLDADAYVGPLTWSALLDS